MTRGGYDELEELFMPGIEIYPNAVKVNDFYYYMEFKDIEPDFDIKIEMSQLLYCYAEASSELEPSGEYTYNAYKIIDNNPATSWVEGVPGDGIDEYIRIFFDFRYKYLICYSIEKFGIINGFAANESFFYSNNRVKSLRLEYGIIKNGSVIPQWLVLDLEDTMDIQYFYFSLE